MFNRGKFNVTGFHWILEMAEDESVGLIGQNVLTMAYDTEIVPITYIGEQYSYANSPWMPFSGFYPNQWLNSRDLNVYFAGNDGYVYQYGVGNTDNGEKISAHYVTAPITLQVPDLVKRLRWIDVDHKKLPDSFLRILYRMDEESDWQLLCDLSQDNLDYPFIEFPRKLFRKIYLRFENAHTGCEFTLNSVSLDMVVRGQQKEMV